MQLPIMSSMPKALRVAFYVFLALGVVVFVISLLLPEKGHEGYWTAFLLHGVAEFWGFALGILVTFVIGVKLAEEKINPIIMFMAKLRKDKVIEGTTARGVVMCAAKIFSEEKLTKDISTSIKPLEDKCDVCALPYQKRSDFRCEHCGLHDHYWKLPKEPAET